jgi:predicted patatin/cPLA2 family phospholipase
MSNCSETIATIIRRENHSYIYNDTSIELNIQVSQPQNMQSMVTETIATSTAYNQAITTIIRRENQSYIYNDTSIDLNIQVSQPQNMQ